MSTEILPVILEDLPEHLDFLDLEIEVETDWEVEDYPIGWNYATDQPVYSGSAYKEVMEFVSLKISDEDQIISLSSNDLKELLERSREIAFSEEINNEINN